MNPILLLNKYTLTKLKTNSNKFIFNINNNVFYLIDMEIIEDEYKTLQVILNKYLSAQLMKNFDDDIIKRKKEEQKHNVFSKAFNKQNTNNESKEDDFRLYYITKDNKKFVYLFIKEKNISAQIKTDYAYDSFIKGSLIDLSNEENLNKYLL